MKKIKFMIISIVIIGLLTYYAYNENKQYMSLKEKYNISLDENKRIQLESENSKKVNLQLLGKVKELSDENEELMKYRRKLELELSSFQNFEIPKDFSLVRNCNFKSDGRKSRYYEYKTNLNKESLIAILRKQIDINEGKIVYESIEEDNSITLHIQFPSEEINRRLYVSTPTYLTEQHIIFYEDNITEEYKNVYGDGCMLLYIPMIDGSVKEVLLNEYFYTETCRYYRVSYILKEYHDQLNEIENSINVNITGEEALNLPVDSTNGWKIPFPENILPTNENERESYLSNLALSLLVGFKDTSGDISNENVVFYEGGVKIKEYKLENFKGRF